MLQDVGTGKHAIHADYLNRWTPQNETEIPVLQDNVLSDRYVEKGDFIRLSNVTIGYTFNQVKSIDRIRIYASAQNLLTISKYSGFDPEVSATNTDGDLGPSFDYGAYPNPRVMTIGLNVTF